MFGWDESHDAYQQNYDNGQPNEAKLSHELVAGGAAFAGFKAFEDHQRAEGKQVNHQFAKEVLAGFAGAEVDRLAETKGMDFVDREKAQHEAKKTANHLYDQHYGNEEGYHPDRKGPPHHLKKEFGGGQNW